MHNEGRVNVAVIGSGIAGMATAYHLQQSGIAATVFEKNKSIGGRFSTSIIEGAALNRGALMYTPFLYPHFHKLVQNFDIEWEGIGLQQLLLKIGDKSTGMNSWSLFKSGLFTLKEYRAWNRLKDFIKKLRFDAGDPDPVLESLHSMDFLTYLKEEAGFNEKLIDYFAQPFCSWAYADPHEIAADYGLYFFAFPVFLGMRTPKRGMQAITDALAGTLSEKPRTGHFLEHVEVQGDGSIKLQFKVKRDDGTAEEKEVTAGCVVFANGHQSGLKKWLPDFTITTSSKKTHGVLMEFRAPHLRKYRLLLYGKHQNSHGIHGGEMVHLPDGRSLGGIFFYRPGADLKAEFNEYKILDKVGWSPAISISTPGCAFMDVKTAIPSVFVVGDFYRYCTIESCAYTASRAAAEIVSRYQRKEINLYD